MEEEEVTEVLVVMEEDHLEVTAAEVVEEVDLEEEVADTEEEEVEDSVG